jgi:hypothetical protein
MSAKKPANRRKRPLTENQRIAIERRQEQRAIRERLDDIVRTL